MELSRVRTVAFVLGLGVSTAALAQAGAGVADPTGDASAAEAAPVPARGAASAGADEIVVTARRDSERLQDVPASISVLTQDVLAKSGVVDTRNIVSLTPGVTIATGSADPGDTQISIRGLNAARDAENNVGLVVDGILKTNTSQLNQIQGELVQVEVLKGPQGAIYGRGAAAGAIVMTTRKPGDELSLSARGSAAENDTYAGQLVLNTPISDSAGIVLFGDYRKTDGFYRNTGPTASVRGANVDRLERANVGGRLVVEPSDAIELDLKTRYGKVDGSALTYDVVFNLPGFAALLGNPLFDENVNDRRFAFVGNIKPDNNQETFEASARATIDLGAATLTAWTLFSDVDQDFIADSTLGGAGRLNNRPACIATTAALFAQGVALPSPQALGPTPAQSLFGPFGPTACDGIQYTVRDQRDVSGEVRLASQAGSVEWSLGAYYLNIDRRFGLSIGEDRNLGVTRQLYNPPGSVMPTTLLYDDRFETDVYAIFGSAEYDITPTLTASAALRYDSELRRVRSLVPDAVDPVTGGPINPGLALGPILPKKRTFDELQPKVNLLYKPSDDLSVYLDYGVGFKAGGFNPQGTAATIQNFFNAPLGLNLQVGDGYRKETTDAYELGVRGRAAGNRLSYSAAVYRTDVSDMQFWEVFTGGFGLVRTVSNIDRVRINGAEASADLKIAPGWSVFAAGNVTDSKIRENRARPSTVGNKAPYAADYTINAGTQAEVPLTGSIDGTLRLDWRRTGPTWFHTVQDQDNPTLLNLAFGPAGTANYTGTRRDAFDVFNLRVGIQGENWSVIAFGDNLFDERTIDEVIPAAEFGGAFVAPGARRTLGVEVAVRF